MLALIMSRDSYRNVAEEGRSLTKAEVLGPDFDDLPVVF